MSKRTEMIEARIAEITKDLITYKKMKRDAVLFNEELRYERLYTLIGESEREIKFLQSLLEVSDDE